MCIVACKLRADTVPGVDDTFVNKSIWIHAEMAGEVSPASIYGSQTYNSFGHDHFQKFGAMFWELDCEESWAPKNWCFWTVMLEETLESPLDCKEIQPVHPKGNQLWIFFGRTDAEAEIPILLRRTDSFEKTLMLEMIEGRRRRGQQRMKWLVWLLEKP